MNFPREKLQNTAECLHFGVYLVYRLRHTRYGNTRLCPRARNSDFCAVWKSPCQGTLALLRAADFTRDFLPRPVRCNEHSPFLVSLLQRKNLCVEIRNLISARALGR